MKVNYIFTAYQHIISISYLLGDAQMWINVLHAAISKYNVRETFFYITLLYP